MRRNSRTLVAEQNRIPQLRSVLPLAVDYSDCREIGGEAIRSLMLIEMRFSRWFTRAAQSDQFHSRMTREKGIELVACLEDSKHAVKPDAGLLQQAITNILGNAIKFTSADGHIELQFVTRGTWAEIAVSDTGCGIPRELLHLISEPFKQVHTNQGNHEALGLGLTIAHHIIAAHKGTYARTVPARGEERRLSLRFRLKIPLPQVRTHKRKTILSVFKKNGQSVGT